MSVNDNKKSEVATTAVSGDGPLNINGLSGEQVNNTMTGGSQNSQFQAMLQFFYHGEIANPNQTDAQFRKDLCLSCPIIDRDKLIDAHGERVAGTCEWILATKEYKAWLRGEPPLLSTVGEPGKGKTVLAVFLSQELEREAKTIYFFCSAADENRNTATAILCGLLWHVTGIFPDLTGTLRERFSALPEDALSSRETLWSMLTWLLGSTRLPEVYCVIDALDECDEDSQQWFAKKIASLVIGSTTLRVVVVSRKLLDLTKIKNQVDLDFGHGKYIDSDVRAFLETKVQVLFGRLEFNTESREEISRKLYGGAEGSFLWIGFAMVELMKQTSVGAALATLRKLPSGLFPLYGRILQNIRPGEQKTSLRILEWVALAHRPLILAELASATRCQPLEDSLSIEETIRDQVQACGHMLRIEGCHVRLVHESVRDYVNETFPYGRHLEPEEMRLWTEERHLEIAQICIDATTADAHALEAYGAEFWIHHAARSRMFAKRLLFPKELPHYHSDIHASCLLGIKDWVEEILKSRNFFTYIYTRAPPQRVDRTGCTPLHYAVYRGNLDIVAMLLEEWADVNATDVNGWTCLHWATFEAREDCVAFLLAHKADVNAKDRDGMTALHWAAYRGHTAVVNLLLEHGAFVDARTNLAQITDQIAWHEKAPFWQGPNAKWHIAMAKLYCNPYAFGLTALDHAVHFKRPLIVRILVDHGALYNEKSAWGQIILYMINLKFTSSTDGTL
jgi:hypothetical protein